MKIGDRVKIKSNVESCVSACIGSEGIIKHIKNDTLWIKTISGYCQSVCQPAPDLCYFDKDELEIVTVIEHNRNGANS